MIKAFGGADSTKGNTGPFWVGSGLAVFSALTTLLLIRPLSHDGMLDEDEKFRIYLEEHGYDTSQMGLTSASETTFDTEEKSVDTASDIKVPQP